MSRLNLFHSTTPQSVEGEVPDAVLEAAKLSGISSTAGILDQIKPKLRELVQEVVKEEQKLCTEVHKVNLNDVLHKLPIIPRIAHQLPNALKSRIKKVIAQIDPSEVKISAEPAADPVTQPAAPAVLTSAPATQSSPVEAIQSI